MSVMGVLVSPIDLRERGLGLRDSVACRWLQGAVADEAGRPLAKLSRYLGHRTNNYAEYMGLLAALEMYLGNLA